MWSPRLSSVVVTGTKAWLNKLQGQQGVTSITWCYGYASRYAGQGRFSIYSQSTADCRWDNGTYYRKERLFHWSRYTRSRNDPPKAEETVQKLNAEDPSSVSSHNYMQPQPWNIGFSLDICRTPHTHVCAHIHTHTNKNEIRKWPLKLLLIRHPMCEHITDTCVLSYPSQSSLASHTRNINFSAYKMTTDT